MRAWVVASLLSGLGAASVAGQSDVPSRTGPRAALPFSEEVALARSAAPPHVSDGATVMVWDGDAYTVGVEGRTGVVCYVSRSWPQSLEPHCFDDEGARTILPIHMLQVRRRHEGAAEEAIDAEIAEGLARGELQVPGRPAMSYMMSEGQKLVSDDGRPVGAWLPHVMLYYPDLSPDALGLFGDPSPDAAVVTDPGTPLSSVMIVVRDFVPVRREGAPRAP